MRRNYSHGNVKPALACLNVLIVVIFLFSADGLIGACRAADNNGAVNGNPGFGNVAEDIPGVTGVAPGHWGKLKRLEPLEGNAVRNASPVLTLKKGQYVTKGFTGYYIMPDRIWTPHYPLPYYDPNPPVKKSMDYGNSAAMKTDAGQAKSSVQKAAEAGIEEAGRQMNYSNDHKTATEKILRRPPVTDTIDISDDPDFNSEINPAEKK